MLCAVGSQAGEEDSGTFKFSKRRLFPEQRSQMNRPQMSVVPNECGRIWMWSQMDVVSNECGLKWI